MKNNKINSLQFGTLFSFTILSTLIGIGFNNVTRIAKVDSYISIIIAYIIGFIPLTITDKVVQVAINFICSMQYNTFRQAQGIPMSTTFCTNHLRQIGISIAKYLRKGDKSLLKKGKTHTLMLSSFIMGAIILAAACNILKEKAIWIAMIPLFINLCILVYADLIQERHLLERTPLGH